jgi:SPP1 gp7 family putative phage head morphogenesis protein
VTSAREILEGLRSAVPDVLQLERAVQRLASAKSERNPATELRAVESLGTFLARMEASADLAGRVACRFDVTGPRPDLFEASATLLGASVRLGGRMILFAARARSYDESGVIPMSFLEAVNDLREREPTVSASLEEAADEVRRVYGGYRDPHTHRRVFPHGFALARSIDLEVTTKVHEAVVRHLARGTDAEKTAVKIAEIGGWTKSYARTIVRTNTTTAYAAGRLREAKRMADDGIVTGFEFQTAGDRNVRKGRPEDHGENHAAMNGVRARHDDPIWQILAPPLGYNCRCTLVPVVGEKLPARARVPARAKAAPGFGRRPDLGRYGD